MAKDIGKYYRASTLRYTLYLGPQIIRVNALDLLHVRQGRRRRCASVGSRPVSPRASLGPAEADDERGNFIANATNG